MGHRKLYSYKLDWLGLIDFFFFLTHHSHTRRLLSSDVLTNRRFSSTKVMVLTAPRWRSYSWTTSPVLMSHCWTDKDTEWNRGVKSTFKMWLNCGDVAALISYRASVWTQCAHSIKREDNRIFVTPGNKQIGHTLVLTVLHSLSFCFFVFLF